MCSCSSGGHYAHADVNASVNIAARALTAQAPWAIAGSPPMTRPEPRLPRRTTDSEPAPTPHARHSHTRSANRGRVGSYRSGASARGTKVRKLSTDPLLGSRRRHPRLRRWVDSRGSRRVEAQLWSRGPTDRYRRHACHTIQAFRCRPTPQRSASGQDAAPRPASSRLRCDQAKHSCAGDVGYFSRCRAITMRWIWLVPSKICMIFASRIYLSTGKSRV
jgi:hypothetical protein